ncbi:MAG TPA: 2-oxo acid dehydrogenase subunit E2, partial [Rhodothermales bacterium]|nr:2-oxo acid dehydrogenase subunit E2 [Rhodothermales bacterium]
ERVRLSTYVLHATLEALKEHPEMNAHLTADILTVYTEIKLGLVVEVGSGVLVACIPDASRKTHQALEHAILDLRTRARNRQLRQVETHGATFTVADLSSFAVDTFTPILLPSSIALLGLGRVRQSCVPTPQGYRPARLLSLSLTFDHRGCHGLRAGRFMTSLVKRLESMSPVPEVVCLN